MTLLIGTVSNTNLVLTADGLSRENPQTGAGIASDNFQKIFPVPGLPVVFVHHGFNILDGREVGLVLHDFMEARNNKIASASIAEIALELKTFANVTAQNTLTEPTNIGVIGFWIAGFGNPRARPELYEVCWPDAPDPTRHEGLVLGGDAKRFVERFLSEPLGPFRPEGIRNYTTSSARQYHQAIYSQAEAKQKKSGENIFGGKQHQIVIEKHGWSWTRPPVKE
jgi:hypothetical protein